MMTKTPYWLVWNEGGDAPTVRHGTQVEAENEATRLAKLNPGRPFVVLAPVARVTELRITLERFEVEDDSLPF